MDRPISWYWWAFPPGPSRTNRNLGKENQAEGGDGASLPEHPGSSWDLRGEHSASLPPPWVNCPPKPITNLILGPISLKLVQRFQRSGREGRKVRSGMGETCSSHFLPWAPNRGAISGGFGIGYFFNKNFVLLLQTLLGWELLSFPTGARPGSGGQRPRGAAGGNPALPPARWTPPLRWESSS